MSQELKPCPFCGKTPDLTKHHREEIWTLIHRCDVLGPVSFDWGDRDRHAARWNRRTPQPGYALVPVEPTEEMIDAADESDRVYSQRAFGGSMHLCQSGEDHWHVMLAAAQKDSK